MGRVGGGSLNTLLGSEDEVPINSINDLVNRFLQALVTGEYPLTRAGGIRPFQLLDACARSDEIRNTYMGHVANSIDRLTKITQRFQDNGEIRKDASPEQLAF